jgi:hypothetical protein
MRLQRAVVPLTARLPLPRPAVLVTHIGEETMSADNIRIGEIANIRAKVKSNNVARVQLLAAITEVLGRHGIVPDDSIVADLTVALPEEISDTLNAVILPGGTNCS